MAQPLSILYFCSWWNALSTCSKRGVHSNTSVHSQALSKQLCCVNALAPLLPWSEGGGHVARMGSSWFSLGSWGGVCCGCFVLVCGNWSHSFPVPGWYLLVRIKAVLLPTRVYIYKHIYIFMDLNILFCIIRYSQDMNTCDLSISFL